MIFATALVIGLFAYLLFRVIKYLLSPPPWPEKKIEEIEQEYIKEYQRWNAAGSIGIRSDLYRLQMQIMDSFAENDPAVDFYYKKIIARFDDIDLSKSNSAKDDGNINFEFMTSDKKPYGFTVKPPLDDCEPGAERLHADTEYLCITFNRPSANRDLRYLFNKNRNHISWQQRAEEVKNDLEKRDFPDSVVIERRRNFRFEEHESGFEGWKYKVYKDEKLHITIETGLSATFDDAHKDHLRHKKWDEEKEAERKAIVDELLSLKTKKEQKHFIGRIIIRDVDMSIFYGPIRDCGPIKAFPFTTFSRQFQELDEALLEELFIHAQTIFALYMNEGECYPENVDVKTFVKGEAEKYGVVEAYEKYFDKKATLADLRQYGLC